jgi:hypothetical protein
MQWVGCLILAIRAFLQIVGCHCRRCKKLKRVERGKEGEERGVDRKGGEPKSLLLCVSKDRPGGFFFVG